MQYLRATFSVGGHSEAYARNYDRIFGRRPAPTQATAAEQAPSPASGHSPSPEGERADVGEALPDPA